VIIVDHTAHTRRDSLSVYDASVSLSPESWSVAGRRLSAGATVSLADDLNRADRDLALRLKNARSMVGAASGSFAVEEWQRRSDGHHRP
jgi:hypothetical protein